MGDKERKGNAPPVRFDVERMFKLCGGTGGATDMVKLLMRYHGVAPDVTAVQMWANRGVIPGQWQAAVLYALMREKHRAAELMTRTVPV